MSQAQLLLFGDFTIEVPAWFTRTQARNLHR
jgi:hypothetical protein